MVEPNSSVSQSPHIPTKRGKALLFHEMLLLFLINKTHSVMLYSPFWPKVQNRLPGNFTRPKRHSDGMEKSPDSEQPILHKFPVNVSWAFPSKNSVSWEYHVIMSTGKDELYTLSFAFKAYRKKNSGAATLTKWKSQRNRSFAHDKFRLICLLLSPSCCTK